ncbi:hypothetical protein BCV70DRAFT_201939 [Testicularia cyperi]|uniref:CRCB-domain-containing protein n=1 Tax=Testicularia cyperi TaxID=1882483 RepID=A0A317XLA8_9BASI|nr:hypothetical protein BCV70DRAFT_201939 [Testicularia cyperi]
MSTSAGPSNEARMATHASILQERGATPALSHKTSVYSSAAETFASATDGEGYYTDARDSSSQIDFDPSDTLGDADAIATSSPSARVSRASSQDTARRYMADAPPVPLSVAALSQPAAHQSVGVEADPLPSTSGRPISDAETTSASPPDTEPGQQIEPRSASLARHHRVARYLAILGLLSFASIWGTLAREGLAALNTYDGQSVTPLVWAQAVGCLVMGLAVGSTNKKILEDTYPPVYIMVTTGFCGSVTTFSAWMLGVFRAFGNQYHYNRGGLHNVMDALTQTAVTLGMSLASLAAGICLSRTLSVERLLSAVPASAATRSPSVDAEEASKPRPSDSQGMVEKSSKKEPGDSLALDLSMCALGLAFWIASAILCALHAPFRRVTFGLVLSPPGAALRWYLSRFNSNAFSKRYALPLGTLAANLLGTALICAAFTASRAGSTPQSFSTGLTGCEALKGLQDGFCSCLSTVSTLAVELRTIRPVRKAVRYAVVSWTLAMLLCILLLGAPWWAIGMDGRCLGTI